MPSDAVAYGFVPEPPRKEATVKRLLRRHGEGLASYG